MSGQARRDAMADAETLLLAVFFNGLDSDPCWRRHDKLIEAAGATFNLRAVLCGEYGDREPEFHAMWYATQAAHAAFQAVPGLRGDM